MITFTDAELAAIKQSLAYVDQMYGDPKYELYRTIALLVRSEITNRDYDRTELSAIAVAVDRMLQDQPVDQAEKAALETVKEKIMPVIPMMPVVPER